MIKALIPSSISGRLLLVVSLAIAGGVYGAKLLLNDMIIDNGMGMLLFPMTCLAVLFGIGYLAVTLVYTFKPGGHPTPLIIFVLGSLLAYSLPTPPPYEVRLFSSHRKDFEHLASLARQRQLVHNSSCSIDRTYATPAGYEALSDGCIEADYQPYFKVEFAPRVYTESIIYIDEPARIQEVMGCYSKDGSDRYQQLAENWFLCSMGP